MLRTGQIWGRSGGDVTDRAYLGQTEYESALRAL